MYTKTSLGKYITVRFYMYLEVVIPFNYLYPVGFINFYVAETDQLQRPTMFFKKMYIKVISFL